MLGRKKVIEDLQRLAKVVKTSKISEKNLDEEARKEKRKEEAKVVNYGMSIASGCCSG
jgi:hypothetical protein